MRQVKAKFRKHETMRAADANGWYAGATIYCTRNGVEGSFVVRARGRSEAEADRNLGHKVHEMIEDLRGMVVRNLDALYPDLYRPKGGSR